MRDFYYDPLARQFERRDNPPPHVSNSEKEPKIYSPAYRRKYPERYKSGYLPWYERDGKLNKKIKQTRMSDWDAIKSAATRPEDIKDIQDTIRSHVKNMGHTKFLSKDELKYLKPKDKGSEIKIDYNEVKAPTYFPTNERIEETPPLNFEMTPDSDLFKGLGSLLATTRKDYKKL